MNILKSNKILVAVTLLTVLLLIATFAPVRVQAGGDCPGTACKGKCVCWGPSGCSCTSGAKCCDVYCDGELYECCCVEV